MPDEQSGRRVGREVRALVSAGPTRLLRSVFIGEPDEREGGFCAVDVEAAGPRAAVRRLEEQIIAAVTAIGGRFDGTHIWDTREPCA